MFLVNQIDDDYRICCFYLSLYYEQPLIQNHICQVPAWKPYFEKKQQQKTNGYLSFQVTYIMCFLPKTLSH